MTAAARETDFLLSAAATAAAAYPKKRIACEISAQDQDADFNGNHRIPEEEL
jgi:hypothetical protein